MKSVIKAVMAVVVLSGVAGAVELSGDVKGLVENLSQVKADVPAVQTTDKYYEAMVDLKAMLEKGVPDCTVGDMKLVKENRPYGSYYTYLVFHLFNNTNPPDPVMGNDRWSLWAPKQGGLPNEKITWDIYPTQILYTYSDVQTLSDGKKVTQHIASLFQFTPEKTLRHIQAYEMINNKMVRSLECGRR